MILKNILKWSRSGFSFPILLLLTVMLTTLYLIQMSYLNSLVNIKYKNTKESDNEFQNDEFSFYSNVKKTVFEGEKLIHLDLKGAPPKINYLLNFITFVKKLGASGILIEYEDMFPYRNEIEEIAALNAYTPSDIAAIVKTAAINNLTIIPLIPTFSHFEFVLKLERYQKFREVEDNPQVLCPSQKKVYFLLQKMIDQVLELHNTSQYLHIGCDEAGFIGMCPECQKLMKRNRWRKDDIYFHHMRKIAEYIIETHPAVRPIVWGDKFIMQNEKIIVFHQISNLVEVMLWNYRLEKSTFPRKHDMNSFAKLFKNIWIAGAFKGATGSSKIVTNAEYHLTNTKGWIEFVDEWKTKINFKGIALTGWQRYNHFSILCELLPVGIPSLAMNLQYINKKEDTDGGELKLSLDCNDFVPINLQDIQDLTLLSRLKCDFPGFRVYHLIHYFFNTVYHLRFHLAKLDTGDLSFYNIMHNSSNPVYIRELNKESYKQHLVEMNELENEIKIALEEIYDQHTIKEWIMTHAMPLRMRLEAATNILTALGAVKVWPRRPLVNDEFQARRFFNKICGKHEKMGCSFFNIH